MKREEILAMKPGRRLDALVGLHVMDLRVSPSTATHLVAGYDDPDGWADPDSIWKPVPRYSTQIAAAWRVVERMRVRSRALGCRACIEVHGTDDKDEPYWAHINGHEASGKTAPEAICKAALLAVMGK